MVAVNDSIQPTSEAGRPEKYLVKYDKIARELCKLGATDSELSQAFNVTISTISLWKVKHKGFSESTKLGKEAANSRIELSLYQRAMGYTHESEEIKVVSTGDGHSEVVRVPIIKHYPPDPASMIFWLKNRRPKEWRDKIDATVSNPDGSNIDFIAIQIAKQIIALKFQADNTAKELPAIEVAQVEDKK